MTVSLREVAIVAGVTRAQARGAADRKLIDPSRLEWVDALVLRVALPLRSLVFHGESQPANEERVLRARVETAVRVVRDAALDGELEESSCLVVSRGQASLRGDQGSVAAAVGDFTLDGGAVVLPVGRWWSEMSWRESAGKELDW